MSLKSPSYPNFLPEILRAAEDGKGRGGGARVEVRAATVSGAVDSTLADAEEAEAHERMLKAAAENFYHALTVNLSSVPSEVIATIERRLTVLESYDLEFGELTASSVAKSSPEAVEAALVESLRTWYAKKLTAWQLRIEKFKFHHLHLAKLDFSQPEFVLETLADDLENDADETRLLSCEAPLSRSDETIVARAYYEIDDLETGDWVFELDIDTEDDNHLIDGLSPFIMDKIAQLSEDELKALAAWLDDIVNTDRRLATAEDVEQWLTKNVGTIHEWPGFDAGEFYKASRAILDLRRCAEEKDLPKFDERLKRLLLLEVLPADEAELLKVIEAGVLKIVGV